MLYFVDERQTKNLFSCSFNIFFLFFFLLFVILHFSVRFENAKRSQTKAEKRKIKASEWERRSNFYAQKSKQVSRTRPSSSSQRNDLTHPRSNGWNIVQSSISPDVTPSIEKPNLLSKEICCLQKSETETLKTRSTSIIFRLVSRRNKQRRNYWRRLRNLTYISWRSQNVRKENFIR